jgi:galactokinase/mevalonate kinase-like predicted kinase
LSEAEPVITIHSVDQGHAVTIRDTATALDFADPRHWDALPKAALMLAGIVPNDPSRALHQNLRRFGGGVSLTIFSGVPKGSGLGTSSIFGATMLAALAAMVGEDFSARRAEADLRRRRRSAIERLVVRTSLLEQMIGTRGGWQDQVGGLVGGFKITRTDPGRGQWPAVERLALDQHTIDAFHARSVLVYTGLQRMAKDILETVVGGWLLRDPRRVAAVEGLKAGAEAMRSSLLDGDLDGFAERLAEYWRLKRVMDPASTNDAIEAMIEPVERDLAAWTLAGAGGGGFTLLVAKDARAADRVRDRLRHRPPAPGAREVDLQVAPSGLDVTVL